MVFPTRAPSDDGELAGTTSDAMPARDDGDIDDTASELGEGRAPVPRLAAEASSESVFLKPPPDRELAKVAVRRFLEAVVEESLDTLARLVDDDTPARGSGRSRSQIAVQWWSQRFNALDYDRLRTSDVYQERAAEVYTAEDLDELEPARDLSLTPEEEEGLVVLNMPALTTNVGGQLQRYFGPKMAFILRLTDRGYLIKEVHEDFRLR